MADGMFKDLINSIENADIFFNPSKYVEREVAREFICKQMYYTNSVVQSKEYDLAITHAWQGFNYVPNADVVEVVHGEWQYNTDDFTPAMRCSVCSYNKPIIAGENIKQEPNNYCPNCGADMRGERKCEDG